MTATTFGETAILNMLLAGAYVSLHTGPPGNTGANELSGGAYVRQATGPMSQSSTDPRAATNTALIEFPVATTLWGTITHFAIWDASTTGNCRLWGVFTTPKNIDVGDVVRFLPGNLTVTAD